MTRDVLRRSFFGKDFMIGDFIALGRATQKSFHAKTFKYRLAWRQKFGHKISDHSRL